LIFEVAVSPTPSCTYCFFKSTCGICPKRKLFFSHMRSQSRYPLALPHACDARTHTNKFFYTQRQHVAPSVLATSCELLFGLLKLPQQALPRLACQCRPYPQRVGNILQNVANTLWATFSHQLQNCMRVEFPLSTPPAPQMP
jgi:hypothetical protein